jgi:hypothetical protein
MLRLTYSLHRSHFFPVSDPLLFGRLNAAMEYLLGSETHSPYFDHVKGIFCVYEIAITGTTIPNFWERAGVGFH